MSESVERYETILKNIHDGVYTLDANGQITWVNETAVEDFDIGYDRDDLIGASVSKVLNDEDIEKCIQIIKECLQEENRESGRCEIALQSAAGSDIPCELHLALLPFDGGEFQGSVGVVRDITQQKQREQRLEVLNRVLRHNLRNEMNVILGHADRLATTVEDKESEENLRVIRETGKDLIKLSDKSRRLALVQESINEDPIPVNVIKQIEDILTEFRDTYPEIPFSVEAPSDKGACTILGHEELFTIAVRNVIENSIEHNKTTDPRVSIEIEPQPDCTRIRVMDNGPGLPEMEQKVLETGAESPLNHSNGLGLWIVNWCVTASSGDVSFDSAEPRGTTVTLDFPSTEDIINP